MHPCSRSAGPLELGGVRAAPEGDVRPTSAHVGTREPGAGAHLHGGVCARSSSRKQRERGGTGAGGRRRQTDDPAEREPLFLTALVPSPGSLQRPAVVGEASDPSDAQPGKGEVTALASRVRGSKAPWENPKNVTRINGSGLRPLSRLFKSLVSQRLDKPSPTPWRSAQNSGIKIQSQKNNIFSDISPEKKLLVSSL